MFDSDDMRSPPMARRYANRLTIGFGLDNRFTTDLENDWKAGALVGRLFVDMLLELALVPTLMALANEGLVLYSPDCCIALALLNEPPMELNASVNDWLDVRFMLLIVLGLTNELANDWLILEPDVILRNDIL